MDKNLNDYTVLVRQEITIELPARKIRATSLEEAEKIGMEAAIEEQVRNAGKVHVYWRAVATRN